MCTGKTSDVDIYRKNRDALYSGLREIGYECVRPDGAFYLFVKAPEDSSEHFCERAKAYELLIVPGANHTDLYDRKIPFDRIERFFREHLN